MFSPFRKLQTRKCTNTSLNSSDKKPYDDDATSPTSACSLEDSISSISFEISSATNVARFGHKTPLDISSYEYGFGDAEPDIARDNNDSAASMYGYEEAAPLWNSWPVDRKTPRRSSMKQSGPGDAEPDIARDNNDSAASIYGYAEASPFWKSWPAERKTPRRSSMKQSGRPRRSSIQFSGEKEVTLPNTGQKVKRRTSISFDEGVLVKQVTRVMDLTENPQKLWFQDEEYDAMKERCYNLVDKVEGGVIELEGKKLCMRGLEGMLQEQSKQNAALRFRALDAVLDEQERQMNMNTFDDQAMANALKLRSIKSRIEAANRAKQDEEEVQKYLSSTRRRCRRLSC